MNEIEILTPDGGSRIVRLEGDCWSLGRSRETSLSFPADDGLSRHHLTFLRDDSGWLVRDESSRNGTWLNGARVSGSAPISRGDKIAAGHLIIICRDAAVSSSPVVVFEPAELSDTASERTVITDLESIRTGSGERPDSAGIVQALIRAGNELAGHRPLPELFRFILDLAIDSVRASRGLLLTLENGELVPQANRGEGFRISSAVRDRVLNSGLSVLVRDTSLDDALRDRPSILEHNIRTLMAVPLETRDRIIGIVYVDSPSLTREFSREDLNLLTVMANVAAVRIEQARFAEAEQARQILERDLSQAAAIQRGLLPSVPPSIEGLEIEGFNTPCRTVGGDYYDFFHRSPRRASIMLADVAGKGMPASLLMMGLQARAQVLIEDSESPAVFITRLNRATAPNCPPGRFVTLFYCLLDASTGSLLYTNAGHNPPLIVRATGEVEEARGGGPVIGLLPSLKYQQFERRLNPGDLLIIYSDGITEAINPQNEEFGTQRLVEFAREHRDESPRDLIETIRNAVDTFTAGQPQNDDITLVVARLSAGI